MPRAILWQVLLAVRDGEARFVGPRLAGAYLPHGLCRVAKGLHLSVSRADCRWRKSVLGCKKPGKTHRERTPTGALSRSGRLALPIGCSDGGCGD